MLIYELAEADAAGGGAAAAPTAPAPEPAPAGQPEGSTAASAAPAASADAGAAGSALDGGEGEGSELDDQDEPDDLDDEVIGAVLRRYGDRPAVREAIQTEAQREAERIVAQREEAARTRPEADPVYLQLAQQTNRALTELDAVVARAAEMGQRPDPEALKTHMGEYGKFVEYTEKQAAFAVLDQLAQHLAGPILDEFKDDPKLLDPLHKQYADAKELYKRLVNPKATPENQRAAIGQFALRSMRVLMELAEARGAAKEAKRAERERRDRDLLVRENDRIHQTAQAQANGTTAATTEPRPRRTPRPKPTVLGPGDLKGDWRSDGAALAAAGVRGFERFGKK